MIKIGISKMVMMVDMRNVEKRIMIKKVERFRVDGNILKLQYFKFNFLCFLRLFAAISGLKKPNQLISDIKQVFFYLSTYLGNVNKHINI